MRKWNAERGMSLVEATIILMVLAVLTSVLAPSIADYVSDARQTKAKEDVEALGTGIMRLLRDTGKPFPQIAIGTDYSSANRVDLLVSEGNTPTEVAGTGTALEADPGDYPVTFALEWTDVIDPGNNNVESASDHLVTNVAAYSGVTFPAAGGPRTGLGWRGGYISGSTGPDPWGSRYGCTTVWLKAGSDASTTGKGTSNDTFCLSPGADTLVSTDMDSNANGGVAVGGDDVIYVFQGATR